MSNLTIEKRALISVLIVAVVAVAMILGTGVVHAHFLGYDSVDDCEIRWEDETQYDTARIAAQDAWESLMGSDDCVDLEPDAWYTIADLEWLDVDLSNVIWAGLYEPETRADHLKMNSHYMDTYNQCGQNNVAMHELGHAHGIQHWTTNANVMRHLTAQPYICALGAHDIDDYSYLWGTP